MRIHRHMFFWAGVALLVINHLYTRFEVGEVISVIVFGAAIVLAAIGTTRVIHEGHGMLVLKLCGAFSIPFMLGVVLNLSTTGHPWTSSFLGFALGFGMNLALAIPLFVGPLLMVLSFFPKPASEPKVAAVPLTPSTVQ